MNVKVYAKGKEGKLVKYEAGGVDTYTDAINLVRTQTGAPRALCVVENDLTVAELPTETEAVVNV